jgi:hypothetical protein
MAYENIVVEVEEHVALIRLNRPDALNALNAALLRHVRARRSVRPLELLLPRLPGGLSSKPPVERHQRVAHDVERPQILPRSVGR